MCLSGVVDRLPFWYSFLLTVAPEVFIGDPYSFVSVRLKSPTLRRDIGARASTRG